MKHLGALGNPVEHPGISIDGEPHWLVQTRQEGLRSLAKEAYVPALNLVVRSARPVQLLIGRIHNNSIRRIRGGHLVLVV